MLEQFYQSERARYSALLSLSHSDDYQHRIYKDFNKTLALLNEIFQLSETQKGRDQIYKIDSNILSYSLIEPLRTRWDWRLEGYKKVDNVILRIVVNLVADLRFYSSTAYVKNELKNIKGICNPTWNRLCSTIYENISQADKRIKVQTPLKLYKTSFASKEQTIRELKDHEDFYNFSGSSIHFEEQFESYINMLRGAVRVGAKEQVVHVFPKSCFGCVIFSMVNAGHRARQQRLSMTFLRELTDGWFTECLYECIFSKMRDLYRKIQSNLNFEDRYELVCLKFTQYDRSVYEYFNKLGNKFHKGTLGKSRKIMSRSMLERELDKIRYKQRLSQECSEINRKYRKKSLQSLSFLEISRIVNADQACFIKQFVVSKMQKLGFIFEKIMLRYDHFPNMEKYELKKFLDCTQNHTILLVKCKGGKIIGGYFTYPYSYENLIGTAEIFTLNPNQLFDFGEVSSRYQIVRSQLSKKEKLNKDPLQKDIDKDQNYRDYEQQRMRRYFDEQDQSRRRYFKRRWEQEDFFDRRRLNEDRKIEDYSQQEELDSEDGEQQIKEPEKISHKFNFKIGNINFRMFLSIKEENKQYAKISWKKLIASLPSCIAMGETQLQVQIDQFQFYRIQGKRPKNK